MNQKMTYIANLYKVNTGLVIKALEMSNASEHHTRIGDKANSFHWIAGHLTASRFTVANMLGLNEQFPNDELFSFGSEPKDPSAYQSIDEIKQAWGEIAEKLLARLEEVTDADLDGEAPFEVPGVPKKIGDLVSFLQLHESYHVGQLAYINRMQGSERLVG